MCLLIQYKDQVLINVLNSNINYDTVMDRFLVMS